MKSSTKRRLVIAAVVATGITLFLLTVFDTPDRSSPSPPAAKTKLYWFIPDGMRADPTLFNVFTWAEAGKLPAIKRMMEQGSYGFCRPTFPSHTPTNFATLFTGAYPEVHGVNDGPMHVEGAPLGVVSVGGFSSGAKKVEPIWVTLERSAGYDDVALLSVPGSTPPELQSGVTIRGRWGGWGADFHAVNFQSTQEDAAARRRQARGARLFFFGPELTRYVPSTEPTGWTEAPASFSPPRETTLSAWGASVHAYIYDSTDDGNAAYDTVAFSHTKEQVLTTLPSGTWSDWLPITLKWRVPQTDLKKDVATFFKIKVIKLASDGFFRIRFYFNTVNRHVTVPPAIAAELVRAVGPMVDFVDNFPPQLIYYDEDKATFLEEAGMSLAWHRSAAGFILDQLRPHAFIHDIYTPNQMLTSRWWMGYVDPASARYGDVTEEERKKLWDEVFWLYEKLDAICAELLDRADENTVVCLTSDHGAVPLDQWVRLNNFFAREGLLHNTFDPETGIPTVDWARTTAIYLKMDAVYVNPKGLAGPWRRGSGPEYENLRRRVRGLLLGLEDPQGRRPIADVVGWEQARGRFRLLPERTGDLIIANRPGFGWNEEMTEDREIFAIPLKTGYKQAIIADDVPGMWSPFLILGPGVKKGHFLGAKPIAMVDQYPTILHLLGVKAPDFVQGRVLEEVLE